LLYALGVILFALGLLISIALHEVGHMVPAKKFGVKVTQYMVGFGPTIWSRRKGDTEYGIKAIPLGGYIRMIGMVPPRADGKRSRWPRRLATAIEDFRHMSRSEVAAEDEPRQFYRLTPGKKMIVMLGGPSMNLLIYLVLMLVLLTTLGKPIAETTTTVSSVSKCVVPAGSAAAASGKCPASARPAPAFGQLRPGDRFVSVDGHRIHSWDQLVALIEPSAGKALHVVVRRHGALVPLTLTPVENRKYVSATSNATKRVGFLGVAPVLHGTFAAVSPLGVPRVIADEVGQGLSAIGHYPSKLASLWDTIFHGKPRDPQGAIGVVGIGRLGGDIADSSTLQVRQKVYDLVFLLAQVNLLLFIFNLLPLLPLDGGHVAGALVEAAKRGRARLRMRRRHPDAPASSSTIFVDTAQMLPVMYAVATVLIFITLLTLYADIVKPVTVG
jgi:membrane-associated protease RseP (regulator of RpoE activity)